MWSRKLLNSNLTAIQKSMNSQQTLCMSTFLFLKSTFKNILFVPPKTGTFYISLFILKHLESLAQLLTLSWQLRAGSALMSHPFACQGLGLGVAKPSGCGVANAAVRGKRSFHGPTKRAWKNSFESHKWEHPTDHLGCFLSWIPSNF